MISRRLFLKISAIVALTAAYTSLSACSNSRNQASSQTASASATLPSSGAPSDASPSQAAKPASSNSIVVYFSHTGENYGVGYISEGNTEVVAKMIAEATGADLFMIEPVKDYSQGYDECCDEAKAEQNENARPAIKGVPDGWDAYKTVYLGYPIWWGDMPQCLYTFIEQMNWADKDVRPFNTHAGSGTANVSTTLRRLCGGATVGDALAISGTTAQNSRDEARSQVKAWLA